jgi:hypothetical protein
MQDYPNQDIDRVRQSVLAEGLRTSIANWRTSENDLEIAWVALLQAAAEPQS